MGMSIRVGVVTNRFPELAKRAPAIASAVIRFGVEEVEREAKRRAPVRTGALRDSIQGRVLNQHAGDVTVGVEYGPYVEYGTRFAPAQPYLTPAAEVVRPAYLAAIEKALADLG